MVKSVILVVIVLTLSGLATAQTSAKELSTKCSSQEPTDLSLCYGYIKGVVSTLSAMNAINEKVRFEALDPYSIQDLADALQSDLREHPEDNSLPASAVLIKAGRLHSMIRVTQISKSVKH